MSGADERLDPQLEEGFRDALDQGSLDAWLDADEERRAWFEGETASAEVARDLAAIQEGLLGLSGTAGSSGTSVGEYDEAQLSELTSKVMSRLHEPLEELDVLGVPDFTTWESEGVVVPFPASKEASIGTTGSREAAKAQLEPTGEELATTERLEEQASAAALVAGQAAGASSKSSEGSDKVEVSAHESGGRPFVYWITGGLAVAASAIIALSMGSPVTEMESHEAVGGAVPVEVAEVAEGAESEEPMPAPVAPQESSELSVDGEAGGAYEAEFDNARQFAPEAESHAESPEFRGARAATGSAGQASPPGTTRDRSVARRLRQERSAQGAALGGLEDGMRPAGASRSTGVIAASPSPESLSVRSGASEGSHEEQADEPADDSLAEESPAQSANATTERANPESRLSPVESARRCLRVGTTGTVITSARSGYVTSVELAASSEREASQPALLRCLSTALRGTEQNEAVVRRNLAR